MFCPILAVTNLKGGSCKTTTALHLGAILAEQGHKVLLLDLDPQGSISRWLREDSGGEEFLQALAGGGKLAQLARPTAFERLNLIAGGARLDRAEQEIAKSGNPIPQMVLAEALADPALREGYDFLVLDLPPQLGFLTLSALLAATDVVIPVEASTMALDGAANLVREILPRLIKNNPFLRPLGILVCRTQPQTRLTRDLTAGIETALPGLLFSATVREDIRMKEAFGHHLPVTLHAPDCRSAADYRSATNELLARMPR
ncbi:MAG: ParA family protein [Thermoanaerobaculia bacterium]|nr:MAG: ParA family protein [Thermoanaerobaculia bacterium]MBZ0100740.1 ParA family protein [Thermoanaerobaculia bacterium]